jgi:hypothetical protein
VKWGPLHQWVPAIAFALLGVALFGFAYLDSRRLDARIKRDREKAAEPPPAE